MGEVYRLDTEAAYDATFKVTGSGHSQAWDSSSRLGGTGTGDVKFSVASTAQSYFSGSFTTTLKSALTFRVYYSLADATILDGTATEIGWLYSTTSFLTRISIKRTGSSYFLRVGQYNDGRVSAVFTDYEISSKGPDWLECSYVRPISNVSADGTVSYRTGNDGILGTQTGIDNYDEFAAINRIRFGAGHVMGLVPAGNTGDLYFGKIIVRDDADPIGPILLTDPSINILTLDAGNDLTNWSAVEGASKGTSSVTFTQESSGAPGRVEYQFSAGRFALNTAHRFTGLITPTILNYPHTDVRWFVRNDTTGLTKYHQMTLDGHSDNGGQSEIGEPKPFNIVFYSTSLTDRFTIGFENVANGQQGCSFSVSNLGVYIVL